MPISINVGLSRKASKDYQSTGVSINLTTELDQSLLAKPDELQAQIDGLFAQVEAAIDRQVKTYSQAQPAPGPQRYGPVQTNGQTANGYRRNGHNPRNGGGMTASQRKAIESIARRNGLDPQQEAHDQFGTPLEELSLRQASELIDTLKAQQPSRN